MKAKYRKKFLKELSLIPSTQRTKIEKFVFESLPGADSIHQLGTIDHRTDERLSFLFQSPVWELQDRIEDGRRFYRSGKGFTPKRYISTFSLVRR